MDRDSTFKDHHFWELQRRDALNSSLSLQIGATTLLIGATYSMSKAASTDCSVANHLLIAGLLVTAGLIAATLYCLVRAVSGYGYDHTPDMRHMLSDKRQWQAVSLSKGEGRSKQEIDDEAAAAFQNSMDDLYAKSAGQNGEQNRKKSRWIFWVNRLVVASLVAFAVSGIPYLAVTFGSPENPTRVHLTNLDEVAMTDNKPSTPPPPPTTSQRQEVSPPPAREPVRCFDHALPGKKR